MTAPTTAGTPGLFRLSADGRDITHLVASRLLELALTDERQGRTDQLDIELDNSDDRLELPTPDTVLALSLADRHGRLVDMGEYVLDTCELDIDSGVITLVARSADIAKSLRVRREISYHDTTVAAMVQQIADRNDLSSVIDARFMTLAVDHFDQTGESDLSVLDRLGELYNAMAVVKAGRVLFVPLGSAQTLSGQPLPAIELVFQRCSSSRLRLEKTQYTGVITYWNETQGAERQPVLVGSDVYPRKIRGTYRSESQARAAASAKWAMLQRAQRQFNTTLQYPNPDAQPQCRLTFSPGWPSAVADSALMIRRVTHRLSGSAGASVDIEAEAVIE